MISMEFRVVSYVFEKKKIRSEFLLREQTAAEIFKNTWLWICNIFFLPSDFMRYWTFHSSVDVGLWKRELSSWKKNQIDFLVKDLVQCDLNLVTLNSVTTCDLVTIFQRLFFNLLHKTIQFSDIMQFNPECTVNL